MSWKSAGFALLVIGLLVISLYRAKDGARESAREIATLEVQLEEAVARRRALLEQLDRKARREWLANYAEDELGMAPARAGQFANELNIDQLLGLPDTSQPSSLRETGEAPQ